MANKTEAPDNAIIEGANKTFETGNVQTTSIIGTPGDKVNTFFDTATTAQAVSGNPGGLYDPGATTATLRTYDKEDEPKTHTKPVTRYAVQTSQEADVFMQAMSNGKTGIGWKDDTQALIRVYDGGSHSVVLSAPDTDALGGLAVLTQNQDADTAIVTLAVLGTLQPEAPLADNLRRGEWLDLRDIARKTGILNPDGESKEAQAAAGRKVWNALLFGANARLLGERHIRGRGGKYYDKTTNQTIDTAIDSPPWTIGGRESQMEPVLFPDLQVPLRVEVILTKDWERLMFDAPLAQYIRGGEQIGTILPGQPSGSWARSIGIALMLHWRAAAQKTIHTYANATLRDWYQSNPAGDEDTYSMLEALQERYHRAGLLTFTRRDLLYRYPPAKGTPNESNRPSRAIAYWAQALKQLERRGIIEKSGEVIRKPKDMERPGYKWFESWLDEVVDIRPGRLLLQELIDIAERRPKPANPKALGPKPKRKPKPKPKTQE